MKLVLRIINILLVVAMVATAAFTYHVKHQTKDVLQEIKVLSRKIQAEEETLAVLKAEWALLTQPTRIQRLAEFYAAELALEESEADDIIELSDIPVRSLGAPSDEPLPTPRQLADEQSIDRIITGDIHQ